MSFMSLIKRGSISTTAPPTTAPPTSAPTTAPPVTAGVSALKLIGRDVSLTTNTAADTMGDWVEVKASTPETYDGFFITVEYQSDNFDRYMVDIGLGSAGNETVVVEGIPFSSPLLQDTLGQRLYVPLHIPAGSRVVARAQDENTSENTIEIQMHGFVRDETLYDTIRTYGITKASTDLQEVDPGDTVDTKGAWVEFISSAPANILSLGLAHHFEGLTATTCEWHIDVGVGEAGSEIAIIEDLYVGVHANYDNNVPADFGMIPLDIPAGSRVAVRAECTINSAGDRLLHMAMFTAEA